MSLPAFGSEERLAPDRASLKRRIILAVGMTGSGKSQCVRGLLGDRERFQRNIILDSAHGDYEAGVDVEMVTSDPFELLDYLDGVSATDTFSAAYRPRTSPSDAARLLAMIALRLGRVTLVIDEAHRSLGGNSGAPENRAPVEVLNDVVLQGRHRRIDLIVATPRPVQIHADIRSEAYDDCYLFRLGRKSDLADVASAHGVKLAEAVSTLPDLMGLHVERGKLSAVKVILPEGRFRLPALVEIPLQWKEGRLCCK